MPQTYYTQKEWRSLPTEKKHEVEKLQLFKHLDEAGRPAAEFFLQRLEQGGIAGNYYWTENSGPYGDSCGCVLGTLAYKKFGEEDAYAEMTDTDQWESSEFRTEDDDIGDSISVVEVLAFNIQPGDTPENNENSALLHEWTSEWLAAQKVNA